MAKALQIKAFMQGNLTNPTVPYYQLNYANLPFPPQTAPIQPPLDVNSSGSCNAYLPNDTTLNRWSSQPLALLSECKLTARLTAFKPLLFGMCGLCQRSWGGRAGSYL